MEKSNHRELIDYELLNAAVEENAQRNYGERIIPMAGRKNFN
jgi:hypothetical protein